MKRAILLASSMMACFSMSAQCIYTCSNYAVSAITFSQYPSGGTNVATTAYMTPNLDDGSTPAIPIGFNFDFYCNTYSNVYICTNGFIQFDYAPLFWPGPYVHNTQSFPTGAAPNGMVAFNMTDLDPMMGGTITYQTIGTSPNQMFIVTYSNVPAFGTSNMNTGQIILHETTNFIEIHTTEGNYAP